MRIFLGSSILLSGAIALLGCGSAAPTSAPLPADSAATGESTMPIAVGNHQITFNPSIQTMVIDTDTMTGHVETKKRYAAFNGDLFYLNINQFAGGFPVEITNVSFDVDLNLVVDYQVAHPFPAPSNLSSPPNGSTNRADLGISGRVMFMFGVDTTALSADPLDADYVGNSEFTFAEGTVRLNTTTLVNPAGYYHPAGMVETADYPAGNATAFPFQQLVDEGANGGEGSRVGISNGFDSTGNYDANAGGWQANNIGANNDGWTGYGFLHQGQVSAGQAVLDIAGAGGTISFDFAVIATYTDPRQGFSAGELRGNRLPKTGPSTFAYYLPHAAVDLERIDVLFTGNFSEDSGIQTGVNIQVVDQDADALIDPEFPGQGGIRLDEVPTASAIETAKASSTEMGFSGEVGLPQLGTGTVEDPKDFAWFLSNTAGTQGGIDNGAYVCFRVADVQGQADEGVTLNNQNPPLPVGSGLEQKPVVYQVAFVEITPL